MGFQNLCLTSMALLLLKISILIEKKLQDKSHILPLDILAGINILPQIFNFSLTVDSN